MSLIQKLLALFAFVVPWSLETISFGDDQTDRALTIIPETISLPTSQAFQTIVVQWANGVELLGEARDNLTLRSSDESIVRIEDGKALPVSNGTATITAQVGDRRADAAVTVSGQDIAFEWSFRNHVESVLSKLGCNGGACHGARAGKNGFRLTLFGFDVDADYANLIKNARGRRVVLSDPGRSLLLTKPTGLIPHKGGVRLDPNSREYRVLADWIAGGAPAPKESDPQISHVEVLPKSSRQTVGAQQQLVVLAHFSDGRVEDVTSWSKYTSENMSVANVDGGGKVQITGSGEGAIKVWYLNRNALSFMSVPFANQVDPAVFRDSPRHNFIDDLILAKLQSLNLPPSLACDDATFVRRVYLDTIGTLPTADETLAFLADTSANKRDRLIDDLLNRKEFVDYWSYKWSDLLLVSGERLQPKAVKSYYQWIRGHVAANTPWDEFVRRLVTASGSNLENGAANFYALHQDPADMAETTAQAFLGLSINCAKCHNHPLEKWTNDQYYGFANLFSRVRGKGWGGDYRSASFEGERIVFVDTRGELIQPSLGAPQPPQPLDAEPIPFDDAGDRRQVLASWLTSPDNPYFARAITNRVWANFFGVGLVEKVDDLRLTNPASNEELLSATARFLVDSGFDLKSLMRAIMQSAAYQRSSEPLPENLADTRFYSRYYPRRLKAEVLLDTLSQATQAPTEFKDYPQGTRALELPDSSVVSYFLSAFGRPDRLITCECERSDEPSMTQVLHIYNGDTVNQKLEAKGNVIDGLIGLPNEQVVQQVYLRGLSRAPTTQEAARLAALLAETPDDQRRLAIEDLLWSVLSSREFVFNH